MCPRGVETLDDALRASYRALWGQFDFMCDGDLEIEAAYSAGLEFDDNTATTISRPKAALDRQQK